MTLRAAQPQEAQRREQRPLLGIKALAEAQSLSRITGLFAQFDLIPDTLTCRHSGPYLMIEVQLAVWNEDRLELLVEKLRAMVVVEQASMVRE